jgi:hypothetical protein
MPVIAPDYRELPRRPSWDLDGGKWYVEQGVPPNGMASQMKRFKPTINSICDELMGTTLHESYEEDGKLKWRICGVRYPEPSRQFELYREGIELVRVFKEKDDLICLAGYRRQVTEPGDYHMDVLFFNLGVELGLTREEWKNLHERMPEGSWVQGACYRRAYFGTKRSVIAT